MQILTKRTRHESTSYRLCFELLEGGGGFAFPCDPAGTVQTQEMEQPALDNYLAVLAGLVPVTEGHVEEETHRWTQPAIGKCDCGELVELEGFTNTCGCGRDYNSAGQLLAPRSQWGEDTGESLADILRIP